MTHRGDGSRTAAALTTTASESSPSSSAASATANPQDAWTLDDVSFLRCALKILCNGTFGLRGGITAYGCTVGHFEDQMFQSGFKHVKNVRKRLFELNMPGLELIYRDGTASAAASSQKPHRIRLVSLELPHAALKSAELRLGMQPASAPVLAALPGAKSTIQPLVFLPLPVTAQGIPASEWTIADVRLLEALLHVYFKVESPGAKRKLISLIHNAIDRKLISPAGHTTSEYVSLLHGRVLELIPPFLGFHVGYRTNNLNERVEADAPFVSVTSAADAASTLQAANRRLRAGAQPASSSAAGASYSSAASANDGGSEPYAWEASATIDVAEGAASSGDDDAAADGASSSSSADRAAVKPQDQWTADEIRLLRASLEIIRRAIDKMQRKKSGKPSGCVNSVLVRQLRASGFRDVKPSKKLPALRLPGLRCKPVPSGSDQVPRDGVDCTYYVDDYDAADAALRAAEARIASLRPSSSSAASTSARSASSTRLANVAVPSDIKPIHPGLWTCDDLALVKAVRRTMDIWSREGLTVVVDGVTRSYKDTLFPLQALWDRLLVGPELPQLHVERDDPDAPTPTVDWLLRKLLTLRPPGVRLGITPPTDLTAPSGHHVRVESMGKLCRTIKEVKQRLGAAEAAAAGAPATASLPAGDAGQVAAAAATEGFASGRAESSLPVERGEADVSADHENADDIMQQNEGEEGAHAGSDANSENADDTKQSDGTAEADGNGDGDDDDVSTVADARPGEDADIGAAVHVAADGGDAVDRDFEADDAEGDMSSGHQGHGDGHQDRAGADDDQNTAAHGSHRADRRRKRRRHSSNAEDHDAMGGALQADGYELVRNVKQQVDDEAGADATEEQQQPLESASTRLLRRQLRDFERLRKKSLRRIEEANPAAFEALTADSPCSVRELLQACSSSALRVLLNGLSAIDKLIEQAKTAMLNEEGSEPDGGLAAGEVEDNQASMNAEQIAELDGDGDAPHAETAIHDDGGGGHDSSAGDNAQLGADEDGAVAAGASAKFPEGQQHEFSPNSMDADAAVGSAAADGEPSASSPASDATAPVVGRSDSHLVSSATPIDLCSDDDGDESDKLGDGEAGSASNDNADDGPAAPAAGSESAANDATQPPLPQHSDGSDGNSDNVIVLDGSLGDDGGDESDRAGGASAASDADVSDADGQGEQLPGPSAAAGAPQAGPSSAVAANSGDDDEEEDDNDDEEDDDDDDSDVLVVDDDDDIEDVPLSALLARNSTSRNAKSASAAASSSSTSSTKQVGAALGSTGRAASIAFAAGAGQKATASAAAAGRRPAIPLVTRPAAATTAGAGASNARSAAAAASMPATVPSYVPGTHRFEPDFIAAIRVAEGLPLNSNAPERQERRGSGSGSSGFAAAGSGSGPGGGAGAASAAPPVRPTQNRSSFLASSSASALPASAAPYPSVSRSGTHHHHQHAAAPEPPIFSQAPRATARLPFAQRVSDQDRILQSAAMSQAQQLEMDRRKRMMMNRAADVMPGGGGGASSSASSAHPHVAGRASAAGSATSCGAGAGSKQTRTAPWLGSGSTGPSMGSSIMAVAVDDGSLTVDVAVALANGSENHHEQLGLPSHIQLSTDVVRRRYLLLVRLLHPDKVAADKKIMAEEAFKRVAVAYKSLMGLASP